MHTNPLGDGSWVVTVDGVELDVSFSERMSMPSVVSAYVRRFTAISQDEERAAAEVADGLWARPLNHKSDAYQLIIDGKTVEVQRRFARYAEQHGLALRHNPIK